ncbi:unnamed protein product [Taenia asiatica]|uniref:Dr1-associated corepressor n=1 Tax=Taenia asiatica TaxID=60517 RepID=A0A0R3VV38_TAEAS|nr:unnamed protein product [Taenia asiatica]
MNRRPVTFENSDDICLDPYFKNLPPVTSEKQRSSNNHREDLGSSSKSRYISISKTSLCIFFSSRVNGLNSRERCNKFRSRSIESSHHTCDLNSKSSNSPSSQPTQEMDQPINGGGQYRHFPPADEVGGDSSDMLNSSSIGDDHLSRRRLVSSNNNNTNPTSRDSDIDNEAPEIDDDDEDNEGGTNVNDMSSVYHMRRQQRRQQQRLRRRDTSSASVCGDTASRRRPPISLSRSSTRIGQSSIPPPPSEPPPSLPPCGIDLSSQYSMYPVLGAGGFNLVGQQTSATPPTMLHIAGLPVNYLPSGGIMNLGDTNQQLLQMQQAALLQQQQQQLHQRIAPVNSTTAMGAPGNPYLQAS